ITEAFFAVIVIPFSRSRSMESIARSGTTWFSRKMPLCRSIASTSVVLPWSTWAMIATFRRAGGGRRGDSLRERGLGELPGLAPPPRPAPDGPVPEDLPDHVDLLPRVDLVPDRLEDLADPGGVRVGPVHQPGAVGKTDVPVAEFFAAQNPDPPGPGDIAPLEGEMDLPDSHPRGLDADLVLGPVGATAVQNALFPFAHRPLPAVSSPAGCLL